ncbi:MAG: DNA-deoxyinosine glycosylase [Eubacterium sp.]|nr:DNA-deoxyinosine glycosylase [Eubacterium sp.]
MENNSIIHPIDPIWNSDSKILILGSFPSVKSREEGFYYGHPQNRFWKVLTGVYNSSIPITIQDKKTFLINNNIAVWDVIHSCEIVGSSDSSIKNVVTNDISEIIDSTDIRAVFTNGKLADKLYKEYIEPEINMNSVCLPSTSPANAAWSLEELIDKWKEEIIK